jgi:hypothetical protein
MGWDPRVKKFWKFEIGVGIRSRQVYVVEVKGFGGLTVRFSIGFLGFLLRHSSSVAGAFDRFAIHARLSQPNVLLSVLFHPAIDN